MEEHVSALVDEIQKKSKIIQYYVLREQAGTLAPPRSDLHKVNKPAQITVYATAMWTIRHSQEPIRWRIRLH